MGTKRERRVVVCALIASAVSCSTVLAADIAARTSDTQTFGITGRVIDESEMTEMRGLGPNGSHVNIRVNGVDHTATDPNTPGSASLTVPLGGGAVARGMASTSGIGASSARVSIIISGVTFKSTGN